MGYKTKIGGKLECTVRIKLLFINTSLINTHYDVKKNFFYAILSKKQIGIQRQNTRLF